MKDKDKKKEMVKMDYVELGVGTAIVALGAFIWMYIKRVKSKSRKFVLRETIK